MDSVSAYAAYKVKGTAKKSTKGRQAFQKPGKSFTELSASNPKTKTKKGNKTAGKASDGTDPLKTTPIAKSKAAAKNGSRKNNNFKKTKTKSLITNRSEVSSHLLNDSPSNAKKPIAEQNPKKKELKDNLVRQQELEDDGDYPSDTSVGHKKQSDLRLICCNNDERELNLAASKIQKRTKRKSDCVETPAKKKNHHPKSDSNDGSHSLSVSEPKTNGMVKADIQNIQNDTVRMNSIAEGEKLFCWIINPVQNFFHQYWEKNACLVKRQNPNYFSHLISFEAIDKMLLKNHVEYTKNIDITSYKNGVRETLNPEGRALPPLVWHYYGDGCSIRLLNPHTFLPALFRLNSTLQEYFHCLVGANAYLTPPNSQGFAPHYDDIEAFILQIEGRKRWKLYKPRSLSETLPRYSSKNFSQKEIGDPILEAVLEPGDMLYFPRGTIHQACTEPGYHSLHITLSVYQRQSYAELFEKMMPLMLSRAIGNNVDLRRGLPLYTWRNAGVAYSDADTRERANLLETVSQLLTKFIKDAPIGEIMDAAVDQVAKKFQHEALPADILPAERVHTVFGSQSRTDAHGECICDYDINLRSNVRLLRANILRLVEEEEKLRVYYYMDNSKEYCEYEPNFIEIEAIQGASVEVLIRSYPAYIGVSELPLTKDKKKLEFATALWERGLLMLEKPFR